jgi:hypothetical protein
VDLQISLNGVDFKRARFPSTDLVSDGYTILDSSTGSLFLQMIHSNHMGSEYGTIVKSNWDGSVFSKVLESVNQNHLGFVDFEKIEGLNGTMMANQISNLKNVFRGEPKKIISKISFDDGKLNLR